MNVRTRIEVSNIKADLERRSMPLVYVLAEIERQFDLIATEGDQSWYGEGDYRHFRVEFVEGRPAAIQAVGYDTVYRIEDIRI